jgi:tetratricopeptide (TPR) repeat protein
MRSHLAHHRHRWSLALALLCAAPVVWSARARSAEIAEPQNSDDAPSSVPAPAPPVAPARVEVEPAQPTLGELRAQLLAGDTDVALETAREISAISRGRDRDDAWFTVGFLEREAGDPGAAADAFSQVVRRGGPLTELARWYQAEQELADDHPDPAIRICDDYRARWPEGEHAVDCLRVQALANAARGRGQAAAAAAVAYDDQHPYGRIGESVELQLALWDVDHDPDRAIPRLQALAVRHATPIAGRVAEEQLASLHEMGRTDAVIPDDTASLEQRALSLRETRRADTAWEVYLSVVERGKTDPAARQWAEAQADSFGWRTRHWDFLIDRYRARYADEPTAAAAWDVFRAAERGGRSAQSAAIAKEMLAKFPDAPEWRAHGEELGRGLLLAGQYAAARDVLDKVAERGGSLGRRSKLSAGFASFMLKDQAGALSRLTPAAAAGDPGSRYWRGRALEASGRKREAEATYRALAARTPWDWYGVLAEERLSPPETARDGRWSSAPTLP